MDVIPGYAYRKTRAVGLTSPAQRRCSKVSHDDSSCELVAVLFFFQKLFKEAIVARAPDNLEYRPG